MASTYQLVALGGIGSRYHVVRPDGLPDVPLTLFANEQLKSLSPSSVPLYVREILVLLNWARTDPVVSKEGWNLTGPPAAVRNLIREYLCVGAKCKLTMRPDTLGLKVTYVKQTDETRINVRILLAALRRLFELLVAKGMYGFPNPLLHGESARLGSSIRENYRQAAKRYQVERKRAWADEQRRWAVRDGMLAEERQMKQLMQDCDIALVEIDLIEKARSDGSQLVKIRPLGVEGRP